MGYVKAAAKWESYFKDCGTGAGGFKPGNDCARGGSFTVDQVNEKLSQAERETGIDILTIAGMVPGDPSDYEGTIEWVDNFIKENAGKPLAWEPDWNRDITDPDLSPKWRAWRKEATRVRDQFRDSLKESDLPNSKKSQYLSDVQKTITNMPIGALQSLDFENVVWHDSARSLTKAVNKLEAEAGLSVTVGIIGGTWSPRSKTLTLDGDAPTGNGGVYAHEFAHSIDDGKNGLSNLKDWRVAWESEIQTGGLTKYATTDEAEGFAEFARLAWSGTRPREIEEQFPKSYQFFRTHRLVP